MSLLLFSIILALNADGQPEVDPRALQAETSLASLLAIEAPLGFVIEEIDVTIEGKTLDWALRNKLDVMEGDSFADAEALVAMVRDQTQVLRNQRVLEEGWIEVTIEERTGRPHGVRLDVYARDTFNLIALPYPKYDSNKGLLLGIRARNYNFLGTMEALRVNLDYERTTEKKNEWSIDTAFTLPFRWVGYDWSWSLSQGFEYTDGEYDINVGTSLGITFPLWPDEWTLTYAQDYDYDTEDDDEDYSWFTSELSFASSIGTGVTLPVFREIFYTPSVFTIYKYRFDDQLSDAKRGVEPGFQHGFKAGRVDWIGNFREGAIAAVTNRNSYNLATTKWDREVGLETTGYLELDPFGFSARAGGIYKFDEIREDSADFLRGIPDDNMEGDVALYWNSDITLKVWTIGNFVEGQGSVFFDMGAVWDRSRGFDYGRDEFRIGTGIEAIGFPLFARSWFMRISVGIDLLEVIEDGTIRGGNRREIFIGFGHHY